MIELLFREDFIGHLLRINLVWSVYALIALLIIHICFRESRSRYDSIWIIYLSLLPISMMSYFFSWVHLPIFSVEKGPMLFGKEVPPAVEIDYVMIFLISTIAISVIIYAVRMLTFMIQSYRLNLSFPQENRPDAPDHTQALRIKIIDDDLSPFVYGVFKPVIILSKKLVETVNEKELALILQHERQHIEHHDYLKNAIQKLVKALFYYNPLILLLDRYLDDLRESACDEEVIKIEGDPKAYANTLFLINEMVQQKVGGLAAVPFIRKTSQLKRRILRMRNLQKNDSKVTKIIIAASILCSSLLLACSDASGLEERKSRASIQRY